MKRIIISLIIICSAKFAFSQLYCNDIHEQLDTIQFKILTHIWNGKQFTEIKENIITECNKTDDSLMICSYSFEIVFTSSNMPYQCCYTDDMKIIYEKKYRKKHGYNMIDQIKMLDSQMNFLKSVEDNNKIPMEMINYFILRFSVCCDEKPNEYFQYKIFYDTDNINATLTESYSLN